MLFILYFQVSLANFLVRTLVDLLGILGMGCALYPRALRSQANQANHINTPHRIKPNQTHSSLSKITSNTKLEVLQTASFPLFSLLNLF